MKLSIVMILLLTCTSCIQLGGDSQPQHYYLLTPLSEVSNTNEMSRDLIFGQIDFPTYLDRPQLITRNLQNELVISNNDRWGEPLQDNLARVLKENLQRRINGLRISSYPWQPSNGNGLLLNLTVNQFDGLLGQQANVDIRWSLVDPDSEKVLTQEHFISHPSIGSSSADLVAGLSEATDQLSATISKELEKIK